MSREAERIRDERDWADYKRLLNSAIPKIRKPKAKLSSLSI